MSVFQLVVLLCAVTTACASTKPNILMLVSDDLGFADVDFQLHNRSVVHTPNLRALAMGGIRLTNHHVQPFCSPTRATLLTGRHVLRYGLQNTVVWPQDPWAVPKNETLLSENLQNAGYRTAAFGKWHLGLYKKWALPMARGFDEQYGYYLGGEDYWTHERNGGLDWHRNDTLETHDNGTYSAQLLGTAAVDFIRRSHASPWFIYLPFQSVHSPLEAPEASLNEYPQLQGTQKTRAAMVTAMDDQVGLITQELKALGQLDSTVIVFTSDNGAPYGAAFDMGDDPAMLKLPQYQTDAKPKHRPPAGTGDPPHGAGGGSNWPLSGWKHWVFEGGVRSASFVRYPSLFKAGSTHDGLFHSVDWLPTLVKLAGGQTSKNLALDGRDISEALSKGAGSPHEELPIQITACGGKQWPASIVDGPKAAMIVGDLKLIVECFWRDSKDLTSAQLYNLTADPAEMHNLAKKRPADLKRLAARLAYWEQQSAEPYNMHVDKSCGEGKPQGTNPPHWDSWC